MRDTWLLVPGAEVYLPLHEMPDPGRRLAPTAGLPDGWARVTEGFWQVCVPPVPAGPPLATAGLPLPAESPLPAGSLADRAGWKVHVSARPGRLQEVLDVVAAACGSAAVPFKYLGTDMYYRHFHHKHAARVQAGKFCAAYPPDVPTARDLMDRLAADLADETGPYVLTDRRYRGSNVVYYRYGSFVPRPEVLPDGTVRQLVRDGAGRDVEDRREPFFVLPDGIVDPFVAPPSPSSTKSKSAAPGSRPLLDGRFEVLEVVRHSNSGGTYRALDRRTGEPVFVKEARAHNGFGPDDVDAATRLRNEHDTLRAIASRAPGLCPEPIAFFTHWEHSFLVTEWVEGVSLLQWVAAGNALAEMDSTASERADYLERAASVADELRAAFDRLHALGLRFGDVSHGNVLIDEKDRVRLIDFETVTRLEDPPLAMATIGYSAPPDITADPDDYGYSALVMTLLFPLGSPLEADPAGRLALHRRDLELKGPIPDPLWNRAIRFYTKLAVAPGHAHQLPSAKELDARPAECLVELGKGLAAGLAAMADLGRTDWIYPPSPTGYATNTHCLAHGTAGVLHALRHWDAAVPDEVVARFRADALSQAPLLSAGLQTGAAGLAWVLTEYGYCDEADAILTGAEQRSGGTGLLGHGRPGIAMARLALFDATGEERHLTRALAEADRCSGAAGEQAVRDLAGTPGLDAGLSGVVVFLTAAWRAAGDDAYLCSAIRLMHAELDQATDTGLRGLRFHDTGGRRMVGYLAIGSAGVATALSRLVTATGDERLTEVLPRVLPACRALCSVEPGLYAGVASWAFAAAEHADQAGRGDEQAHADAIRIATGLAKYVVRGPGGLRVLGSFESRYHADLATGSAGVLLALARLLRGTGAGFLTGQRASEEGRSPALIRGRRPRPRAPQPSHSKGIEESWKSPPSSSTASRRAWR